MRKIANPSKSPTSPVEEDAEKEHFEKNEIFEENLVAMIIIKYFLGPNIYFHGVSVVW